MAGSVVLVFGPGGSGKSTTAAGIAGRLRWRHVEEDRYWVERGWGTGLRTEAQEASVQASVLRDILAFTRAGRHVVIDFILYKEAPNPLSTYRVGLGAAGVPVHSIALSPAVDAIMQRMTDRGRPNDLDKLDVRRTEVIDQLRVLESIDPPAELRLDTTELTVTQSVDRCIEALGLSADS